MTTMRKRNIAIVISGLAFVGLSLSLTFPVTARVVAQGALTDTVYDATASEMLTVSSTALAISAGVRTVSGVANDRCYITTEGQPIRWTTSGTTPTAAIGHLVAAGGEIVINGRPDIAAFRMIRTGTDASVAVTCSRRARQ